MVLCLKFGVSIFIGFGDIKRKIFTLHSHRRTDTRIRTNQFPKTPFLDSEDLKTYRLDENSTSEILTENNTSITLR